ncbi:hypothetical protein NKJ59_10750 [Mesorhizobium australicum]|uniref:hypothetical protein n=1 Tax=Mesorhizobium australicum TaxID=536018 RepID=UPI003336F5B9
MPAKIQEPPPKPGPQPPVRRPDKEAPSEPEHVDPPPRDVREAPAPNPNGDKKAEATTREALQQAHAIDSDQVVHKRLDF